MRKKSDLPSKMCARCGRPFTWRKKWERVWDEVKYCSDGERWEDVDWLSRLIRGTAANLPSPAPKTRRRKA